MSNPFEEPHAQVTPPKESGRMTLIIGAMVILALAVASHELARMSYIQVLVQGDPKRMPWIYTLMGVAGVAAPLFALAACIVLGIRRAIIAGAAIGLIGCAFQLASLSETLELAAFASAIGRGMIEVPIYVALGRRTLKEPESRDAWFIGTLIAINLGSFLGSILGAVARATSDVLIPIFAVAFLLGAILTAVVTISDPPPAAGARPPQHAGYTIGAAMISLFVCSMATGLFIRNTKTIPGSLASLGESALTLLLAVTATVVFASKSTPLSEDRARQKIGAGVVLGGFAYALLAAGLVALAPAFWAYTLLDAARQVLVGRIALGLAASFPSAQRSIFLVAGYSFLANVIHLGATTLSSQFEEPWVMWPGVLVSLALGAALIFIRTDSDRRST